MPNDFSQDSSCKALWNFESPGYGDDSKNSNDLTDPHNSVVPDSQYYRQGSYSGSFSTDDSYLFIPDGDLCSGFPGKSGDTTRQETYAFWLYLKSAPATTAVIFAKDLHFGLQITVNSKLYYRYRYMSNGQDWDWDSQEFGPALQTGRWYHISISIDGKEEIGGANYKGFTAIYCAIYDSVADTTMGYTPGAWGGCVHAITTSGTSNFTLGAWPDGALPLLVGNLDEFVVFNRCLSFTEMIAIRKGTFPIPQNNFTGASLKGYWKFDSVSLADSGPDGNNLPGTPSSIALPPLSAVGNGSSWFWATNCKSHGIIDSNLSAGFPFKDGDTVKKGTFCLWYYGWPFFGSSVPDGVLLGKKIYGGTNGSFNLAIGTDNKLKIEWNGNGTLETFTVNFTLVEGVWYHLGLAIDGIAKTCSLRIYDSLADTSTTYTFSPAGAIGISSYPGFGIGSDYDDSNSIRCFMDDVLAFNDTLSVEHIDQIKEGTYGVAAGQAVTPTGIATEEGHGSVEVTRRIPYSLPIYDECIADSDQVYGGRIQLLPEGIASAGTVFGTPSLSLILAPAGITPGLVFGTPGLTLFLLPEGISSAEAFGTQRLTLSILPASIPSAESLGSPNLQLKLIPEGISTTEGFGSPGIELKIVATGIATAEAFGSAELLQTIHTTGIPTAEEFGSPGVIVWLQTLHPVGLVTAEAFGTPRLTGTVIPVGIATAEAEGIPTLHLLVSVLPSGIASTESFGSPALACKVLPIGLVTAEVFGTPRLALVVLPSGITSEESAGTPGIVCFISPSGIMTAEEFGSSEIVPGSVLVQPAGISSSEFFGNLRVFNELCALLEAEPILSLEEFGEPRLDQRIHIHGTTSEESFGNITLFCGPVYIYVYDIDRKEAFGRVLVRQIELAGLIVLEFLDLKVEHSDGISEINLVLDYTEIVGFDGVEEIDLPFEAPLRMVVNA